VPPNKQQPAPGTKPPKIVIDGVFFQFRDKSGIARVWSSLLEEWSGTEFGQSLVVLDRDGAVPKFSGIGEYVPFKTYYSRSAGAETFLLEEFCRQVNADLFMSTHLTSPLETPSLMLVHDLIPEIFGNDPTWVREKRYCTQHASAYLAVSNHTLSDLHRIYPFSKKRPFRVAYNGVGKSFHRCASESPQDFKARHNIKNPYFLLVGTRSEHKNARLFFEALALIPDRERFSIVCCGGAPELESELAEFVNGSDVKMLSLSDEELNAAYGQAICLVYPSKYEGFGLPVLEAMAAGCPVITCANASIPEIAGNSVLYVNESDCAAMRATLVEVQAVATRERLIQSGCRQASKFKWADIAGSIAEFSWQVLQSAAIPADSMSRQRWRQLRSYQCSPNSTAEGLIELETLWRNSIDAESTPAAAGDSGRIF